MKIVLKIARLGMCSSAVLLNVKPMEASAAVVQSPVVAIQRVTADMDSLITLQYKTNLLAPAWQTLGDFSGSTNLSLLNPPAAFFRCFCSHPTVSITLAWPPSTDPSVVGYKIYYGLASGNYTCSLNVGPATTATISHLAAGTRYYFAATAYNASRVESPFSNETNGVFQVGFSLNMAGSSLAGGTKELTVTPKWTATPMVPTPLVITKNVSADISNPIVLQYTTNLSLPNWQTLGVFSGSTNLSFTNLPAVFIRGVCSNLTTSATLAWQPSTDPAVVGYKLYYGLASHDYTHVINVGPVTMATVSNLAAGVIYYFAATAYDSSGVQSPFSNEASGAFQANFSLTIENR